MLLQLHRVAVIARLGITLRWSERRLLRARRAERKAIDRIHAEQPRVAWLQSTIGTR